MSNVRIQDDLYTYVNQEKLDSLVIPDDKPTAGGFQEIADSVEKTMMSEFNEMSESANFPNAYLKNACELFKLAKNAEKKEQDGIAPVLKDLAILDEIDSFEALTKAYKELHLRNINVPFEISVDTDMKNTKQHCVLVKGPSTLLPDASYYKEAMAAQKEMILGIWTNVAKMVISKTDLKQFL